MKINKILIIFLITSILLGSIFGTNTSEKKEILQVINDDGKNLIYKNANLDYPNNIPNNPSEMLTILNMDLTILNNLEKDLENPELSEEEKKSLEIELKNKKNEFEGIDELTKKVSEDLDLMTTALANGGKIEDYKAIYGDDTDTIFNLYGLLSKSQNVQFNEQMKLNIETEINQVYNEDPECKDVTASTTKECNDRLNEVLNEQISKISENLEDNVCDTTANECYEEKCNENDIECINKVKLINEIYKANEKRTLVKTNQVFEILDIFNMEPKALSTLRLFGVEPDYSYLPNILKNDIPSNICLAKIDGYLDTEIKTNGRTTNYNFNENQDKVQVMYDLRAQRTEITPNDKTSITYSYFVRAPQNEKNVTYAIAVGYLTNGALKRVELTEPKTISKGSIKKGFDTITFPIEEIDTLDENSFKIYLRVRRSDGLVYIDATSDIYLINIGDDYKTNSIGNDQGYQTSVDNENSNSQNTDPISFWE